MLFKDVIGQETTKTSLLQMVSQNRLSHALLFIGKEGSGALPLALAFSQYVSLLPTETSSSNSLFGEPVEIKLPLTPQEADAWMQNQSSFSKGQALVHPDIHYAYPVITKKPSTPPISTDYIEEWREFIKQLPYGNLYDWLQSIGAENKQGNITAAECNDIMRKLNLKSFESGYKILVLWMPEYLGKEGNKLLKLIEEPPPQTLFILVAESEESILSTILSRCQLIRVPQLSNREVADALVQVHKLAPSDAARLAAASAGNYREAVQMIQHAGNDFNALLKEWMNATLKDNPAAQVKLIEEIARMGRESQKQFLRYFLHLLETAIRVRAGASEDGIMEEDLLFAQRLNKAMDLHQQEAIANELDKCSYYIERNANAKILFHALTIKIFYIVKSNLVFTV